MALIFIADCMECVSYRMRTVLLLLTVSLLLLGPATGQPIYFTIGTDTTRYTTDNMEFSLTDIGEGASSGLPPLTCNTDAPTCCRNNPSAGELGPSGEWRYPNRTLLLNSPGAVAAGHRFYSQRNAPQVIRLNRRQGLNPLSPTGSYCCTVPTGSAPNIVNMTLCANFVVCLSLPSLTNGKITYDNQGVGGVATHSCDPGYTLSGPLTRICGASGVWNGITRTCDVSSVTCPDVMTPGNGVLVYSHGTQYARLVGSTVTYSCDIGYVLSGTATRACGSDGMWTPDAPTCQALCPDLSDPANGVISYNMPLTDGSRLEGSVATHSCDTGYSTSGGVNLKRKCQNNRSWSGLIITCDLICPILPTPANGDIMYSDDTVPRDEGSTANYTCNNGYQLSSTLVSNCTSTGWMSVGSTPSCIAICDSLTLNNGEVTYSSDGRLEGTTATHSCNNGFTLDGPVTRTCQNDTSWSIEAAFCRASCVELPPLSNGIITYSPDTRPILTGATANHTCSSMFVLSHDSPTRTCTDTEATGGMWSGVDLVCVAVTITSLSGLPVAGSAFSLTCDVTGADSLRPTITYQWLRGGTVLTTGPLLEFQPHLFLSDSGYYTCSVILRSDQLYQDRTLTQIYQLIFETLSIQLRFSDVNCVDYAQVNTMEKVSDITSKLSAGIASSCACGFNSSLFTASLMRCFINSPQIVTFRAQLRPTAAISVVKLLNLTIDLIQQKTSIVVQGLALPLDFSCPLVIPNLDSSDECPKDISTRLPPTDVPPAVPIGPVIGGVAAVLLLITVVIIIAVIVVVAMVNKHHAEAKDIKESSRPKRELPVVLSELPEYEEINKYQDEVTFTANTAYTPTIIN